jgi:hypothetical protein
MKINSNIVSGGVIALLSLSSTLVAEVPAYKVEKSFGLNEIKAPPVCVSMDVKDRLHVLLKDGTVLLYDTDGKMTGSFKTDMKPVPTTMTVADDKIYLFASQMEEKTREFEGKKVKVREATGVKCCAYDPSGAKQSEIKLTGVFSATDAHFIGGKLVIADYSRQCLVFFVLDGNEGKISRKISKVFRLCCGIFDFCPGSDANSIMVANLGAFKVQTIQEDKTFSEFGARGEKEAQFRGCCNPVNVACLADGSIVTVEKSPTRVKIYEQGGKTEKLVTGLGELVEGCSEIPITVDSKGALYLASDQKNCIVKCVPGVAVPAATADPVDPPVK